MMQEFRFAFRQLGRYPAFTAFAVLILGLGIGANTAIFSVVNAVWLRPLPYPQAGQLVQVRKQVPPGLRDPVIGGGNYVGGHEFVAWREQSQTLQRLAAYGGADHNLTGLEQAERVLCGQVTADFFPLLGVRPAFGRTFLREEERPNSARVAVLGHGLWQRRFGSDPRVVGRNLTLDNQSYEVVGVLPAGFQFPEPYEVWLPMTLQATASEGLVAINLFRAIARLKAGVSLEQAQTELNTLAQRAMQQLVPALPAAPQPGARPVTIQLPPGAVPSAQAVPESAPPGPPALPLGEAPPTVAPFQAGPSPTTTLPDVIGLEPAPATTPGLPVPAGVPTDTIMPAPPGSGPSPGGTGLYENSGAPEPGFMGGSRVNLVPLHEHLVANVKPALLVLLGAVVFVLLIACGNVANLLLARAVARQKEIAIRAALGAESWRLVRQLLTESVVLALLGGLAGVLLALWASRVLTALSVVNLPHMQAVQLDGRVLAFTLATALVTGLCFGLAPALQAVRLDLSSALKEGSDVTAHGPRSCLRHGFVAAETALALVLCISAGLLMKSFLRLRQVEPGFRSEGLLTFQVNLNETKYPGAAPREALIERIAEELKGLPGAQSAAVTDHLPLTPYTLMSSVSVEGRPPASFRKEPPVSVAAVTTDYFGVMGMALEAGRLFGRQDRNAKVVAVNASFARQFFPGQSAVGKRLRDFESPDREPGWLTIVGVVADARQDGLDRQTTPEVYRLGLGRSSGLVSVVVRTAGDPLRLADAARARMRSLDKDLPVYGLMSMEQRLAATTASRRVNTLLLGGFALLAVGLAAVGIYGVMAFAVTQRTREIGVRMALGARTRDVLGLVLGQGLRLALAGVSAGLVAAWGLTRYLSSLLFEVPAADPATFITVSLALLAIGALACLVPAARAARVDPVVALRYE